MISAEEARNLFSQNNETYSAIISELDSAIRLACSKGEDHVTYPVVFTYEDCDRQTESKYKYLYHYLTKLGYKVFQEHAECLEDMKKVRYTISVVWTP